MNPNEIRFSQATVKYSFLVAKGGLLYTLDNGARQRSTVMNGDRSTEVNGPFNVNEAVQQIRSREDFVAFVRALECDLRTKPSEWENRDLPEYLEALAAWVEDMEGYYRNSGEAMPSQPTWKMLGEVFLAARVYE